MSSNIEEWELNSVPSHNENKYYKRGSPPVKTPTLFFDEMSKGYIDVKNVILPDVKIATRKSIKHASQTSKLQRD